MLSVIIPALNEQHRVIESALEIIRAINSIGYKYEIIFVNDGSTDSTYEKMLKFAEDNENVIIVNNIKNLGLGAAYKAGLSRASGDYITWVPSDLSHKEYSVIDAYKAIGQEDMIIPIPKNPHVRSITRRIISFTYTFIINIISGNNIPYYNGLSVHKRDILKKINIDTTGFGFQAEIIIKLLNKGASYKLVDTYIEERLDGGSKAFALKNFFEVVKTIKNIFLKKY
jgi:glycosyltransferase involved in cell wall biosynthesis